jgi:hypothetical protein
MTEEKDRAGLGKVIYSTDSDSPESSEEECAERVDRKDVEEADKESFPASDPPGFSGSSSSE